MTSSRAARSCGELAAVLGPGKHVVAVPGGNQNAANIQNRVHGALEEAKKYPDITIKGVFYSKETPQDAAAKIEEVQTANPDIDGWAMIGSWSLFTDALMKWEPGKVKIVAMDALPAELPYLQKGVVSKLYAQQTYQWGCRSMELLVDKVILGKAARRGDGILAAAARHARSSQGLWGELEKMAASVINRLKIRILAIGSFVSMLAGTAQWPATERRTGLPRSPSARSRSTTASGRPSGRSGRR